MVTAEPALLPRVPLLLTVPEPTTLPLKFTVSVPSFCSVRPLSVTDAVMARLFVAGLVVVPLPLIVPPDQVPPLFSVRIPLPLRVPPVIVNASADALALRVAVPKLTFSVPTLIGTPTVTVAPVNVSVPVPPIEPPPMECVPPEKERVPGEVTVKVPLCVP